MARGQLEVFLQTTASILLSIMTGNVLDFHVMSKYCRGSSVTGNKLDQNSEKYKEWKENHKCEKNYDGSSPGMEVEGARVIFSRSEEKNAPQYTRMLGDGDSKGYEEAKKVVNYGIEKLDCINHVAKRMGTFLRN